MGNCMETEIQKQEVKQSETGERERARNFVKVSDFEANRVRVKIVLTKEELELLLLQLKSKDGQRLEDVLGEIERSREKAVAAWKPSLESITESPEVPEMDR